MKAWPIVLKSLGYLWFIIQIVIMQSILLINIHEMYLHESVGLEYFSVWMVILAIPGAILLIVAEKLKAKR